MARRNDHTHEELKAMAIAAGKGILISEGYAKFSARKVAKEIGYTIGTIYNIFDNHDHLILCINATTLDDLGAHLSKCEASAKQPIDALKQLTTSYINFASDNYNCWIALFEHSLPKGVTLPDWYRVKMNDLLTQVEKPLLQLFNNDSEKAEQTAQTLWASVHGICQLGLTGKLKVKDIDYIINLANNLTESYIKGIELQKECN